MKAINEIYDFIAGGSIASPVGLALAILITVFDTALPMTLRAGILLGTIVASAAAASFEKVA